MPRRLLPLLALLLLLPLAARAQSWPERPIRLIIPFGAGGISDSVGRIGAEWLSKQLGVPVVADNRPGGNGAIGMEAVLRSPADGYTLLGASASHLVVLPLMQRLTFDPQRDFTPISMTAGNPLVLAVATGMGPATLPAFRDFVAARPGQLQYASGGTGGLSHLGMEVLLQRLGLQMEHVPYRSGPLAMQDMMGGRIQVHLGNALDMTAARDAGMIRLLAVTGTSRSAILPDVPTVAEQGWPGFEVTTWNGLAGPAGLPPAIRDRIAGAMRQACGDDGVRRSLLRIGADPLCSTPAEMAASMQRLTPIMREAIALSGATVN
ncbi:tripartite tricarboxylate transporter substrate binding protein [Roseomonas stagni]|uniref:Tripartite tricarboxylate transporter substrate binding protein n=1 Tax=Falsiroseomonas algicola TaxID=2716930 RepID=A0A6M1LR20_9PROT|nr:tripartite tricarboxylate transporter substrate binding protein [Falsiroseomonas algicola]NGM22164.1 tripartite tricarboxylate transporter substrate binding protein [Falsiroseomonas algicola]